MKRARPTTKRGTLLLMVVGLLASLFLIISAFLTLARSDNQRLKSSERADQTDAILRSADELVLSTIRQSMADANGQVLAGGWKTPDPKSIVVTPHPDTVATYSPENIPGTGGTSWLSGAEVVHDNDLSLPPISTDNDRMHVCRQTVSSFDGPRPAGTIGAQRTLRPRQYPLIGWGSDLSDPWSQAQIWFDATWRKAPGDYPGLLLDAAAPYGLFTAREDLAPNARRPFMDADGDGVPDSSFVGCAPFTDMANAIAGSSVSTPRSADDTAANTTIEFNPSAIQFSATDVARPQLAQMWQRYNERAKYEMAVKIESNGGKIALASPGQSNAWNRQFVVGMFNWVRNQSDTTTLTATRTDPTFDEIHAAAPEIEPYLRHRGGLLPTPKELAADRTGLPKVLKLLENSFPDTFVPRSGRLVPLAEWQRFNLAPTSAGASDSAEFTYWYRGSTLDPERFNPIFYQGTTAVAVQSTYSRRQLLTTISNSDDLARDVDPKRPDFETGDSTRAHYVVDPDMGIYAGAPKFYLGDIARAFNSGLYKLDENPAIGKGNKVVRRLANYYYEMLSAYAGWEGETPTDQAITRRAQAFMLAVNTVAFAAPRVNSPATGGMTGGVTGFIDAVWYTDIQGSAQTTYIGYAPQPYISQVLLYNKPGEPGRGVPSSPSKSLAVELYLPHDPNPNPLLTTTSKFDDNDPFAIDLDQYGISINPGAPVVPLSTGIGTTPRYHLCGRRFVTLSVRDKTDGPFELESGMGRDLPTDSTVPDGKIDSHVVLDSTIDFDPDDVATTYKGVTVFLWRRGSNTGTAYGGFSNDGWYVVDKFQLAVDNLTAADDEEEWYAHSGRHDSADVFLGGNWSASGSGPVELPARWALVNSIGQTTAQTESSYAAQFGAHSLAGAATPHLSIPLYTMNAGSTAGFLTPNPIHGAVRPRSFPTVGFMHFIPRFSHRLAATGGWEPMGTHMLSQWKKNSYSTSAYPVDFGHMPIFDNTQKLVDAKSYFGPTQAGQLPWGLLVYDYFTTLDPNMDCDGVVGPDIDVRRIPGRIDINTAPWYVLAGLPVIDPLDATTIGAPGSDNKPPDPAFWSPMSGVLVGQVLDGGGKISTGLTGSTLLRFDSPRLAATSPLFVDPNNSWIRLGPVLAQSVAAYRDRISYNKNATYSGSIPRPLWGAEIRNRYTSPVTQPFFEYRREAQNAPGGTGNQTLFNGFNYGPIRRDDNRTTTLTVCQYGFLSLGELVNVKGFESPVYANGQFGNASQLAYNPLGPAANDIQQTPQPDFFKAVSLMALLDTHFLTTRSNTFTVYMTLMNRDPEQQQSSVRVQYTVDRSNILPALAIDSVSTSPTYGSPQMQMTAFGQAPIIAQPEGLPEIIGRREGGYYDMQYDQ